MADQCVKRACSLEHRKAWGDRTNASVPAGTLVPRCSAGIQFSCYVDPHPVQMTASFRATATLALRRLLRLATRMPQDLSCECQVMQVWVGGTPAVADVSTPVWQ